MDEKWSKAPYVMHSEMILGERITLHGINLRTRKSSAVEVEVIGWQDTESPVYRFTSRYSGPLVSRDGETTVRVRRNMLAVAGFSGNFIPYWDYPAYQFVGVGTIGFDYSFLFVGGEDTTLYFPGVSAFTRRPSPRCINRFIQGTRRPHAPGTQGFPAEELDAYLQRVSQIKEARLVAYTRRQELLSQPITVYSPYSAEDLSAADADGVRTRACREDGEITIGRFFGENMSFDELNGMGTSYGTPTRIYPDPDISSSDEPEERVAVGRKTWVCIPLDEQLFTQICRPYPTNVVSEAKRLLTVSYEMRKHREKYEADLAQKTNEWPPKVSSRLKKGNLRPLSSLLRAYYEALHNSR